MKVSEQVHGNVTILCPHGPLVGEELQDLRRAVETAGASQARRVILDMADVPYLDSGGIEYLLETCNLGVSSFRRPKLAALSETCLEVLELTDVLPRLEVYDTVENALRSCQR
jgi:anti-anti-sigma factor